MNCKQNGNRVSHAKKRKRAGGMMAGALALCLLFGGCVPKEPAENPTQPDTGTEITRPTTGNTDIDQGTTVIEFGKHTLDNKTLSFYYWDMYYYVGYIIGGYLDLSIPLDQQAYTEDQSWHDMLLQMATNNWLQSCILLDLGQQEGFTLSEEYQEDYNNTPDTLAADAADQGYESADEYLKDNFGDYADLDSYMAFLENAYYTSAYSQAKQEEFYNEISATGEVLYEDTVNVRHILVPLEVENAKEEAQRIYDDWKNAGTEEEFATLANEHSTDPGSNTKGGLYENVAQGTMIDSFDQWIFDASRQVGDSGIVETSYGYHIMYYVGIGEPAAITIEDQTTIKFSEWLTNLMNESDYTIYADNVLIGGNLLTRIDTTEN